MNATPDAAAKSIVLSNSFHNTTARVHSSKLYILQMHSSERDAREAAWFARVHAKLCGSRECTCGTVRE